MPPFREINQEQLLWQGDNCRLITAPAGKLLTVVLSAFRNAVRVTVKIAGRHIGVIRICLFLAISVRMDGRV